MKLLLVWVVFGRLASAGEILWLKLEPRFAYKDISVICSNDDFPRPTRYFGAEVDNGKVTRAVLQTGFVPGLEDAIALDAREVKEIELFKDESGNWWIRSAVLSHKILNWFFFRSALDTCEPPQALTTIEPMLASYSFPTEEMNSAQSSESNLQKFSGRRKDGGFYEARLGFIQRQYPIAARTSRIPPKK